MMKLEVELKLWFFVGVEDENPSFLSNKFAFLCLAFDAYSLAT